MCDYLLITLIYFLCFIFFHIFVILVADNKHLFSYMQSYVQ